MWTSSHQATPSGEQPTPEQMEQWRQRMCPPENELPAGVGLTALLGRTEDAAVGITQVEAFSSGFRFTLAVRLRRMTSDLAHGRLFRLISSHPEPGVEIPLADRLLLGIEYANGHRTSTLENLRMFGPHAGTGPQELLLLQQGGGGGQQSVDQTFWVSPLPPEGPVTVVLSWPSFGMPESRTILDGTAIRTAAEHSHLLWPPQPPMQPPMPPSAPRPPKGWFAEPPS